MVIWALVNVVLTALALLFAQANAGSPHRLRFHGCLLALLGWLVPWSILGGWMPDLLSLDLWQVEQRMIASSANAANLPLVVVDTRAVPLANDFTLLHLPLVILLVLLASGLALYLWTLLHHHLSLKSLRQQARDASSILLASNIAAEVQVLAQNRISGAFSSGIVKPIIWVHNDLLESPELPTLLRHELTHIEQHDNLYLLVITLVEKLFWWNPLVIWLGRQTRQLQELSCDERCRASNAEYPAHLAQLMLTNLRLSPSTASEDLLLSANIFNNPTINMQRLKVLQRSHQMKPRHIVSAVATAVIAITTVGLVTAQPENKVIVVGGAADATFTAGVPVPDGAGRHVVMGFAATEVSGNQVIKIEKINDEERITFKFTDAMLPMALGPLAQMLAGPPVAAVLAVPPGGAAPAPGAGPHIVMSTRTMDAQGQVVVQNLTPAQIEELKKTVMAQAVPNMPEGATVKSFVIAADAAGGTAGMPMPFSDKLVLETEDAKTRKVTVEGESLTLDEAIEAIAKAANCNIFKDGKTVVVDWCGPLQ